MKMTILNPKLREPKLNDYLVIGEFCFATVVNVP